MTTKNSKTKKGLQSLTKTQLVAMASALIGRAELAAKLGQQYGGDRDVYEALGYKTTLTFSDYFAQYERQDIANAVINRPVNATWRGGVTILESKDDDKTKLEKAWNDLYDRLKLHSVFTRLDKLTGIGQYGVLLLGLSDVTESRDLANPVSGTSLKLHYVKPLSENSAKIKTWEDRADNERFGLPNIYDVTITDPQGGTSTQLAVHHSRIVHISGDLLESETLGTPRLQAVFNRLFDLEKLVGGSAEMFWRGARPGYQGIVDKDFQEVDTSGLQDQFDEFEHNLRRYMINAGIEMKSLAPQVENPESHVDVQLKMISAVTGIPLRILTGSERGELASSQDERAWKELIQARRDEFASPVIVRQFIDTIMVYGILPEAGEDGYTVIWQDLWAPSEKEQVDIGKVRADALEFYSRDALAKTIVPPEAFLKFFLGLSEEQQNQIAETLKAAVQVEVDDFTPSEGEEG